MILYRYIIKEHIFPFFASLSIIVFLFLMQWAVVLLDRIISKGLDPKVVLEIFVIQLGWIIALAIPMAILTATLMTFGQMAGDNEIMAIKASGSRSLWPRSTANNRTACSRRCVSTLREPPASRARSPSRPLTSPGPTKGTSDSVCFASCCRTSKWDLSTRDQDVTSTVPAWVAPTAQDAGTVGKTLFDLPDSTDLAVTVVVQKDKLHAARRGNRWCGSSRADGRNYLGIVWPVRSRSRMD